MILAHGPWVWDPRQPFLRRIVLVPDINGQPEIREERKSGVINPNTGEESYSTKSMVIAYGRDVLDVFAERFLMDAKLFRLETVSPVHAAEWVASRPRIINEFCERLKDDAYFEEWLDKLIWVTGDPREVGGPYEKIEWLLAETQYELWSLWDEWMDATQP